MKTLVSTTLTLAITLCAEARARIAPITATPNWNRAMPNGPDATVKITEEYAKLVGRDAYFWAWPMVNIYNRRLSFAPIKESARSGPLIMAPLNHITMLTGYLDPLERAVACPNQDVVYGIGGIALDLSPVVVQVPDFGERFWVYQIVDERTDSFVHLGSMYGRNLASISSSDRTGTVKCQRVLPRYSVPLPTPGLWDRASSWTTHPRTSESFRLRWLAS